MIDPVSLAALDATTNDYESAASVCGELSVFLGKPISEAELFSVLRTLEAQQLVKAYRAAPDGKSMVPTASSANDSPSDVWFSASPEGRNLVEREWESTFGKEGPQQRLNPPLPPLDADGGTLQVGDQVVIIQIPHWLIHDLPAEDQASLKTFEGKTLSIHEIDKFGYVWFSTQLRDFCLRPEEVRRV